VSPSILRALDILEMFSRAEPRLSLTEISRRLGVATSTAHSLLHSLVTRGYMEQTENRRYALGPRLITLTQSVRINVELRDRAAPLLRNLADAVHESVYLAALDGDCAVYVYAIESARRLMARTAVGNRAHLHATSLGKAMLAHLPEDELEAIVARTGLQAYTEATITDMDALMADLERTRERGYAVDAGGYEHSSYCIAAPIFDARGQVIAACSVSGRDPALVEDQLAVIAPQVSHTAQEISRRMGFVPSRQALVVTLNGKAEFDRWRAPDTAHGLSAKAQ